MLSVSQENKESLLNLSVSSTAEGELIATDDKG
jgi:hypothetical protein